VPVLQIRSQDIPEILFPPGTDLLQVLWCPNDHEECGFGPAVNVFWRGAAKLTPFPVLKLQINSANKGYVPRQCRLQPETVLEYPSAHSLSRNQIDELEQWKEDGSTLYQYELSVAPGFKIGGYPNWSQETQVPTCSCGKEMDYFMTIDSAEFDGGTYRRWLPESERHVWHAAYEIRNQVQRAAGLMLGDMGEINIFICKTCVPWKYQSVFQCS
jgi:hypothetical protein